MKKISALALAVIFIFFTGCSKAVVKTYKFDKEYSNLSILSDATIMMINENNGTNVVNAPGSTKMFVEEKRFLIFSGDTTTYLMLSNYDKGTPVLFLKEVYSDVPNFTSYFDNRVKDIKFWYDYIEGRKTMNERFKKQNQQESSNADSNKK